MILIENVSSRSGRRTKDVFISAQQAVGAQGTLQTKFNWFFAGNFVVFLLKATFFAQSNDLTSSVASDNTDEDKSYWLNLKDKRLGAAKVSKK